MSYIARLFCISLLLILGFFSPAALAAQSSVAVLVYHNINPTIPGSMTITPDRLESQLKWLKDNNYTVIPMKDLVAWLQGKSVNMPAKAVVITADDGWESQYKYLYPLARKYQMPVTLFIYPETISKGKNAMTWEQLKELQDTGLFDVQDHTYSHPNFKQAKKHLSPEAFEKMVHNELFNSKEILEKKMGKQITLLAWPFGIYNDYLEQQAAKAGYTMAFTIDYRRAKPSEKPMSQPRYMIVVQENMPTFVGIVKGPRG